MTGPDSASPTLSLPVEPQPQARAWREAFARLSAQTPPCPGIRPNEWSEMHSVALRFLAEHADRAAEPGWTTELLFGVHPDVGAIRADACGALMYSTTKPVLAVERDRINFGNTNFYRTPGKAPSIPVWDWREPKRAIERKLQ